MQQINAQGGMITLIHFTYQEGEIWRIACMPNMTEFHLTLYHPSYARSNDIRAVTCPQCKKSQQGADAQRVLNVITKS